MARLRRRMEDQFDILIVLGKNGLERPYIPDIGVIVLVVRKFLLQPVLVPVAAPFPAKKILPEVVVYTGNDVKSAGKEFHRFAPDKTC